MWLLTLGANPLFQPSPLKVQWGGYLRFVYVFLLAIVFPFICWGQSGQAGHPHPRSHFVFADPPEVYGFIEKSHALAGTLSHPPTAEVGDIPLEDVAGQSLPATIALFSLLLVFAFCLWLHYRAVNQKHLFFLPLGRAQIVPARRFPPPRTH